MPFMNGKRVTLEEWRAAHPTPTLYGYDSDGNRFVRYPGDDGGNAQTPNAEGHTADVGSRTATLAAIADALGLDPADPEVAAVVLRPPGDGQDTYNTSEGAEGLRNTPTVEVDRREVGASRFSREHGLPKHRRTRHSQTYEGRRERYIRQKAERLGITFEVAAHATRRNQRPSDGMS